ncbi:Uncharacterised protein [Mycobacteroides abscessus]|nr:Uncharacterised protein [Mycobacteroides abscessus]
MAWPEGDKRNDAFADKLRAGYLGIYAPSQPPAVDPIALHQKFVQEAPDRKLLEYIAEQLGPGHPDWASKGMTLRDKVWSK